MLLRKIVCTPVIMGMVMSLAGAAAPADEPEIPPEREMYFRGIPRYMECMQRISALAGRLASNTSAEALEPLLADCDIDGRDAMGDSLLHSAVSHENIEAVRILLGKKGVKVNALNVAWWTPLQRAISMRSVEIVGMLVVAPGIKIGEDEHVMAARYGTAEIVALLRTPATIAEDNEAEEAVMQSGEAPRVYVRRTKQPLLGSTRPDSF